jgi:NAD(P)-dependent dehydrogenase (short-subunit alcohol dehydrogenase family)
MPLAIITGANTGLGFETARGLLGLGYQVVITSRDLDRGSSAVSKLKAEHPRAEVSALPLDLARQQSIDSFASSFAAASGQWDVLVLNAGAKVLSSFQQTDSGIEYHFGVNAVGHFSLTADLLAHRAQVSRVVSVSSIVARFAPATLGPSGSSSSYSAGASYSASKLSNYLFAMELEKRFGSESFSSLAAHPGFARAEPYGPSSTRFFESFLAQSAAKGALPITEAAANSSLAGGSYRVPKILELWGSPAEGIVPKITNAKTLKQNWEILESLSGKTLTL